MRSSTLKGELSHERWREKGGGGHVYIGKSFLKTTKPRMPFFFLSSFLSRPVEYWSEKISSYFALCVKTLPFSCVRGARASIHQTYAKRQLWSAYGQRLVNAHHYGHAMDLLSFLVRRERANHLLHYKKKTPQKEKKKKKRKKQPEDQGEIETR